jgi:hypothetical protein
MHITGQTHARAQVASARGPGHIVQGYASGKVIQYEIEGSKGERFMVHDMNSVRNRPLQPI